MKRSLLPLALAGAIASQGYNCDGEQVEEANAVAEFDPSACSDKVIAECREDQACFFERISKCVELNATE